MAAMAFKPGVLHAQPVRHRHRPGLAGSALADGLRFTLFAMIWLLKAPVTFTRPNLDTFTTLPLASRNAPSRQFGRPKVIFPTGC